MHYRICFNAQEFLDAMRVAMKFADKDDYSQAVNCIYIGRMPGDGSLYSMVSMNGKSAFRSEMHAHGLKEGESLPELPFGPDYKDDLPPGDRGAEQYFHIPLKEAKSLDKIMPKNLGNGAWIVFDIETLDENPGGSYKVTVTAQDTSYSYTGKNYSMYDFRHWFNDFENWADLPERLTLSTSFLELATKAFKNVEKVRVVLSETRRYLLMEDPDRECPYQLLMAAFLESRSYEDDTETNVEPMRKAV